MRKSFKLVTLFDIPVEVNFSWFFVLILVVCTLALNSFPYSAPGLSPLAHWLMAILTALLLFASLLAHEYSHSLVAVRNQLPIHGISLFIFGGVAHMEREPQTPGVEFRMAIAGPIMSFFLAGIFWFLSKSLGQVNELYALVAICSILFTMNLGIGIFNLIPGFPLDGGRVLRAIIWHFTKDLRKATAVACGMGKLLAYLLIGGGLYNLFSGSLVSGVWFIFVGLFLQEAADIGYRQVLLRKMLSGVKVGSLMSKSVVTVPPALTLDKLVDDCFFKFRHSSFPVMEDDKILGIVTLHDVKDVEKDKWGQTEVRAIMIPISHRLVIDQFLDAMEALPLLANNGVGRLLVVDKTKLLGVLSQRDIMRLFEYKTEVEG